MKQEGRKRELKRRIVASQAVMSRIVRMLQAGGNWEGPVGRYLERDGILDWTRFVRRNEVGPDPEWYARQVWYRSADVFDWWPTPIEAEEGDIDEEAHGIQLQRGPRPLTVGLERASYWQVYFTNFWDTPDSLLQAVQGSEIEPPSWPLAAASSKIAFRIP